jgi:probable poly-beta-1,6-N-acetyl-D-glucosamine export protein
MQKQYVKAIDAIRTASILAVLLIHTTTRTIETTHNDLNNFPWTLFLNQIARFAVPLFILISGFVLELNYDYHTNYWSYIKKRVGKILIPYLFWSLIYYYFVYTNNHDNLIKVVLTGDASYQLYFIPTLAIFYLVFPILHKFYKFISNKFVLIGLGAIQLYFLSLDYFVKEFKFADPIRITLLSFFFFIVGMVAARNKDKIIETVRKWKYLLISSVVILGFYVFLEGKVGFQISDSYLSFYSQWRPSVFFYTLGVFSILFYAFDKSRLQFAVVEKFSKLSYFVFFIHVIILEIIWKLLGHSLFNAIGRNSTGKIFFDPIFFVIVATTSFGIAHFIHKVPNLKRVTG